MRPCVPVLTILALAHAAAVWPMPPEQAAAWQDDLRFMAREMERTHKDLYHSLSREEFAAKVAALEARIPSLERHEVIVEMARIVAAVGDGHTNIYPTRDPRIGFHSLPIAFTFFGDSLYVRAVSAPHRALLGARVLRIGDRDVGEAYEAVRTMIGRDNEQGARYWVQYLLAMPEVLHALRITRALDAVPLTVATPHGEQTTVLGEFEPVEPMTGDRVTLYDRREGWVDARDLAGRPDPLWLRRSGEAFHFEHAGDVLYVQINQVADTREETLAHFSGRLGREIAATHPGKLALDLRLNRGGDGTLVVPLIRTIIRATDIDCPGRLFAIIGPATFSAAQMLVDALERYTNVTFVGEPTGSRGNAFGDSRKIILPHSGITVRVSIYYWQEWHPMDRRSATMPQIPAPMTFEAYRANDDPALDAITGAPPGSCPQ